MKKLLVLVLIAALIFVLCGCSDSMELGWDEMLLTTENGTEKVRVMEYSEDGYITVMTEDGVYYSGTPDDIIGR